MIETESKAVINGFSGTRHLGTVAVLRSFNRSVEWWKWAGAMDVSRRGIQAHSAPRADG